MCSTSAGYPTHPCIHERVFEYPLHHLLVTDENLKITARWSFTATKTSGSACNDEVQRDVDLSPLFEHRVRNEKGNIPSVDGDLNKMWIPTLETSGIVSTLYSPMCNTSGLEDVLRLFPSRVTEVTATLSVRNVKNDIQFHDQLVEYVIPMHHDRDGTVIFSSAIGGGARINVLVHYGHRKSDRPVIQQVQLFHIGHWTLLVEHLKRAQLAMVARVRDQLLPDFLKAQHEFILKRRAAIETFMQSLRPLEPPSKKQKKRE